MSKIKSTCYNSQDDNISHKNLKHSRAINQQLFFSTKMAQKL